MEIEKQTIQEKSKKIKKRVDKFPGGGKLNIRSSGHKSRIDKRLLFGCKF